MTNPVDPQDSQKCYILRNTVSMDCRDRKRTKLEKGLLGFQKSAGGKWANKTTQLQTHAILHEKRMTLWSEWEAYKAEPWAHRWNIQPQRFIHKP